MLLFRVLQHLRFMCRKGRDNARSSPSRNVERNGENLKQPYRCERLFRILGFVYIRKIFIITKHYIWQKAVLKITVTLSAMPLFTYFFTADTK